MGTSNFLYSQCITVSESFHQFHSYWTQPTTSSVLHPGPQPSEALGTRSVFGLPEGCGKGSSWKSKVHQGSVFLAGSITLDITSPADAPVGEYRLSVKTSATASVGSSLGKLLLLFNPWCKGKHNSIQNNFIIPHGEFWTMNSLPVNEIWEYGKAYVIL